MLKKSLCNCDDCKDGNYCLEEKKNNGRKDTLSKVTICDIPLGALIIKMEGAKFNGFFIENKEWGFNKHSECVIVTENKMVFIEMKSQKEVNQDLKEICWKKFNSDCCVINYADNVFQKMLKKNSFFENKEPHFVLLYQTLSISKTPIVVENPSPNLTPETFRQIPVVNDGTISFYRII